MKSVQINALNQGNDELENTAGTLFFSSELTKSVASFQKAHILSFNSLVITRGVGFGEELSRASDLVLGDVVKASRGGVSMPVHFVELDTKNVAIEMAHSTSIERVFSGRTTARLTLMSDYSQIIQARVLKTQNVASGGALMLLDKWMDKTVEHTIIELSLCPPATSESRLAG